MVACCGDMRVGIQRETCRVVAERVTQSFHVHPVLQGQRGECVPEIVEPNLVDARSLEQRFHLPGHRWWIEVGAALGRWEQQRAVEVSLMLTDQQVNRLLGQHDFSHCVLCFRRQNLQRAVDSDDLFAHGNGAVGCIDIRPKQGQQFSPAQAGGELQVEHREVSCALGFAEEPTDLLWRDDFHLLFFLRRDAASVRGVARNQSLGYCF